MNQILNLVIESVPVPDDPNFSSWRLWEKVFGDLQRHTRLGIILGSRLLLTPEEERKEVRTKIQKELLFVSKEGVADTVSSILGEEGYSYQPLEDPYQQVEAGTYIFEVMTGC